MSEEFIIRNYATRTAGVGTGERGSARALSLQEARALRREQTLMARKYRRTFFKDSLEVQAENMKARREAYEKAVNAGIVGSTREGKDFFAGETSEVQDRVSAKMAQLTSKQLDVLESIVRDKRVVDRMGAVSWFERQRKKAEEQRPDVMLNLTGKELIEGTVNLGRNLFDDKGFGISIDPFGQEKQVTFTYQRDF